MPAATVTGGPQQQADRTSREITAHHHASDRKQSFAARGGHTARYPQYLLTTGGMDQITQVGNLSSRHIDPSVGISLDRGAEGRMIYAAPTARGHIKDEGPLPFPIYPQAATDIIIYNPAALRQFRIKGGEGIGIAGGKLIQSHERELPDFPDRIAVAKGEG